MGGNFVTHLWGFFCKMRHPDGRGGRWFVSAYCSIGYGYGGSAWAGPGLGARVRAPEAASAWAGTRRPPGDPRRRQTVRRWFGWLWLGSASRQLRIAWRALEAGSGTEPNGKEAFAFDWRAAEGKGFHHAEPQACLRKAAFLSRRTTDPRAIAGRQWPPRQDEGTKPKWVAWRLGGWADRGPRKRAATAHYRVGAAPREIRNKAIFGSCPKRIRTPVHSVRCRGRAKCVSG